MAKEGVGGSSRESNVNLTTEGRQGGEAGGFASRLEDLDDPLLDLGSDPEAVKCDRRLLVDFGTVAEQTGDTSEVSKSRSRTRDKWGNGSDLVPTEAKSNESQCFSTTTAGWSSQQANSSEGLHCESLTDRTLLRNNESNDLLDAGDPTILNTNLPFFPTHRLQLETYPASTRSHFTYANPSKTSTLKSATAGVSTTGVSLPSQSRPPGRGQFNGTMHTTDSLPDVAMKQPLLHTHSQSPTGVDIGRDAPDETGSPNITANGADCCNTSGAHVIDYTHDADPDYLMPATLTNVGGSYGVMLDSFPPSSSHDGRGVAEGGGEGGRQGCYGSQAEEIHCHSGTVGRNMSDRLARRQLLVVLVLCVMFMIGETVGGVLANSLALFTDVLHLASDLISYGISLLALYLANKQATRRMTFGYHRAEVLGALFSVFIIWLVSGVLCYIAVERIMHEHYKDVKPNEMLITASLGVIFNLIMGFVLHSEKCCSSAKNHAKFGHGHSHSHNSHDHNHYGNSSGYEYEPLDVATPPEEEEESPAPHAHKNINVRAAFIHVVGDIIQSVGVLVAALIIKFKEDEKYRLADPICTFVFSLVVLCTTISILKDTLRIIMEGAPQGVDFEQLKLLLMSLESVVSIHNLNVWALTMDRNALSVHLAIDTTARCSSEVLKDAHRALKRHKFYHLTIQVEPYNHDTMSTCNDCQLPFK